jgi:hypothetical protein
MDSLLERADDVESLAVLSRFRLDLHACLTARGDELFELADAVLCAEGPVRTLAGLSLAPEHRRGHGALTGWRSLTVAKVDSCWWCAGGSSARRGNHRRPAARRGRR